MFPFLKISVIWAILNCSGKKEILIIIANGIFGPTSFLEFKLPIIDSIPSFVTASTKNEFKFWFFRQLGKHLLDFGVLLSIFQLFFQRIFFIFYNLIPSLQTSWLRFIRFIIKYYFFYTFPYFNQICLVFFKIIFCNTFGCFVSLNLLRNSYRF